MYSIYPEQANQNIRINDYCVVIPDFFNKEELEKIDDVSKIFEVKESLVGNSGPDAEGEPNKNRSSDIRWIEPQEETTWIYEKMTEFLREMNGMHYMFNINGFEAFQHATYKDTDNGRFTKHIDESRLFDSINNIRKISYSILLNDPSEYEGGELHIWDGHGEGDTLIKDLKAGYLVAFPSFLLHEVTPVTKGTRKSLVCWARGPRWS